jgi:hypothetical protein
MTLKSRQIRRLNKKKRGRLSGGDPLKHARVCRSKIRVYDTAGEAQFDLDRLVAAAGYDPTTRVFSCTHCHRFHIGRPDNRTAGRGR